MSNFRPLINLLLKLEISLLKIRKLVVLFHENIVAKGLLNAESTWIGTSVPGEPTTGLDRMSLVPSFGRKIKALINNLRINLMFK